MTTLLVTRHRSGFINVEDRFSIGNFEHEGSASVSEYRLPEGYSLHDGSICDPAGYQCGIFEGEGRAPVLISMAGPVRSAPALIDA